MCDSSAKLIAWMDRELPGNQAADVERHVRECAECRRRVHTYEELSRVLVAHGDATLRENAGRRLPHWVLLPVVSGAAAVATLLLVLHPASLKQIPVRPEVAAASPTVVVETAPRPVKRVHRRHALAPIKNTPDANWALPQPAFQIAIPVEAMFPPGAVPQGITMIADVTMAPDGSVQALRLQP